MKLLIKIQKFPFPKMHLKISFTKRRLYGLGGEKLKVWQTAKPSHSHCTFQTTGRLSSCVWNNPQRAAYCMNVCFTSSLSLASFCKGNFKYWKTISNFLQFDINTTRADQYNGNMSHSVTTTFHIILHGRYGKSLNIFQPISFLLISFSIWVNDYEIENIRLINYYTSNP